MNGWEIIFSSDDERTERLGVHGGWLYRVLSWDLAGIIISQCMAFGWNHYQSVHGLCAGTQESAEGRVEKEVLSGARGNQGVGCN